MLWRRVRVGALVVAALAAVLALRSHAPPPPAPVAEPTVAPSTPPPTREPLPSGSIEPPRPVGPDGADVVGYLPRVGGPSEAAAGTAAGLVLRRYCWKFTPRFTVAERHGTGWREATVQARVSRSATATFTLYWAGSGRYQWSAHLPDLARCN